MNSSSLILDLFRDTIKIRRSCSEQRKIFRWWMDHNSDPVYQAMAFDTETTGLTLGSPTYLHIGEHTDIQVNNPAIVGISMAIPYKDRIALFWGRHNTDLYSEMAKLLEEEGQKVGHNAKYDVRTLRTNGIRIRPTVNCTLTMARIYWDRLKQFGLDKMCEILCPELSGWKDDLGAIYKRLKTSYTKKKYPKGYVNYSFLSDDILGEYSMKDVFVTLMLNIRLRPEIDRNYVELYERERQVMLIVARMEERGILFDSKHAFTEAQIHLAKKDEMLKKMKRIAGKEFKPTAKKVLNQLLSMDVTESQLTNRKGAISTGKDVLEILTGTLKDKKVLRFVDAVITYRSLGTLVGSFLLPLRRRAMFSNGVVYYTINPTDTRTGRMAGRDPNLQNIPRINTGKVERNPVRGCFIVRRGFINYFHDYSQMELAMFAFIAGDKEILKAYTNGEDLHSYMTTKLTGITEDNVEEFPLARQRIKSVNFGVIYGMGLGGLAHTMKTTARKAGEFYDMYMERFSTIRKFQEVCNEEIQEKGYVEDPFGRRYHIDAHQAYKAVNSLVQGGCAQAVKIAFIKIDNYVKHFERVGHILVPIHDEFMVELKSRDPIGDKPFVDTITESMEVIPQLIVHGFRFRVEVKWSNTNWAEKRKYAELFEKTPV